MTWVKLGDEFPGDADDAALSDAAFRTHVEALAWSNQRLLDLVVPKRHLTKFAYSPAAAEAVEELVRVGWWIDDGVTWRIVHRIEWQPTRAQVAAERAAAAERQRRARAKRHGVTSGEVTPGVTPAPARPGPKEPGRGTGRRLGAASRARRCDRGAVIAIDGTCCDHHDATHAESHGVTAVAR